MAMNIKQIGYWLTRSDAAGKLFLGTNPKEIADSIKTELIMDYANDLPWDERSEITIKAAEITQDEIDNMLEFEGW